MSSRQTRRNDGYIPANAPLTSDAIVDDVFQQSSDELENNKMSLPPRYRFRDLLLGDFAFTDDGQRWVTYCSDLFNILSALRAIDNYMQFIRTHCSFMPFAGYFLAWRPANRKLGNMPDVKFTKVSFDEVTEFIFRLLADINHLLSSCFMNIPAANSDIKWRTKQIFHARKRLNGLIFRTSPCLVLHHQLTSSHSREGTKFLSQALHCFIDFWTTPGVSPTRVCVGFAAW